MSVPQPLLVSVDVCWRSIESSSRFGKVRRLIFEFFSFLFFLCFTEVAVYDRFGHLSTSNLRVVIFGFLFRAEDLSTKIYTIYTLTIQTVILATSQLGDK